MKLKIKSILGIALLALTIAACGNKANTKAVESKTEVVNGVATSTFKVWGNCSTCKETIEGSLKVDGIIKADWDKDNKMMTVSYDDKKISLEQIQKDIASVGYDNEKFKGDDKAYKELPECCQYERK